MCTLPFVLQFFTFRKIFICCMVMILCFFRTADLNTVMYECLQLMLAIQRPIFIGGQFWAEAPG